YAGDDIIAPPLILTRRSHLLWLMSNASQKLGFLPHPCPNKQILTTLAHRLLRLSAAIAALKIVRFQEPHVVIPAPINNVMRAAAMMLFVVVIAACSRSATDNVGLTGVGNTGAGTPGSQQEFIVTVGDRIFFETDSSSLTSEAMATLDKQAQWLNQYPNYRVMIEGHADERGTREYNIALGARRSNIVVNYLVSKGVAAQRITSQSFGKERPVAICNDISCWSQNRRAVTVVQ